jgi:putative acetyltransferase
MTTDKIVIAVEPPDQPEVRALINELDALQVELYPAESNHFVGIASLSDDRTIFLVARKNGVAIGCGAVILRDSYGEIKRMFVSSHARGLGLGRKLITALEAASLTQNRSLFRLETGIHQPDAIRLYEKAGYVRRGPFGGYPDDTLSVFMEKTGS